MNISESRDPASGSTAYTVPSGALLTALTTEHFALQTARSSTVAEANGRSALFLKAVSGATVALALVAQLDQIGPTFTVFALSVLPALLALGVRVTPAWPTWLCMTRITRAQQVGSAPSTSPSTLPLVSTSWSVPVTTHMR